MKTAKYRKGVQLIFTLITWFGIILQLYILIDNAPKNNMTTGQAVGRFLLFFTVLTNILVGFFFLVKTFFEQSRLGKFFSSIKVATAITVYIVLVGLVYNVVLRRLFPVSGRDALANEIQHVIVPVIMLVYWWLYVPQGRLRYRDAWLWLLYPACYLAYALIRGYAENFYAYPFINLNENSTLIVVRNCILVAVAFLLSSWVFIFFGSRKTVD
jgi:hypothetical protein